MHSVNYLRAGHLITRATTSTKYANTCSYAYAHVYEKYANMYTYIYKYMSVFLSLYVFVC